MLALPRTSAIAILALALLASPSFGQKEPFSLISVTKRTLSKAQLTALSDASKPRTVNGRGVIVTDTASQLVVQTGPDDDMLSYRIAHLRNPVIVLRQGSRVKILFVNVDDDMQHDLRFGDVTPPQTSGTVGSHRLAPSENGKYSAEEITLKALDTGSYPYFCSVSNHAIRGMRGLVRVLPAGASEEDMMKGAMMAPHDTSMQMPMGDMQGMHMDTMKMGGMKMDTMKMGGMNMDTMKMPGMSQSEMGNMSMTGMSGMSGMQEDHGLLRTEPMSQEGSGTSWMPAASPMYMLMTMAGDWSLHFHGDIMPRYTHQGGPRGADKFDAPNWFMAMAEHPVGADGQFSGHLMMSLDPITESGKGYPLLLQTGETWQGMKLVDFQHPHDLFDEVSVAYSQRFSERSAAYLYLGYPGEPALGPPVFMHRTSAMANPNAPLTHHWMDATHITFGVATAGVAVGDWKLEGSYFNGSEPDENRYDFDPLKLNSYSGRLSFNPTENLSFQASTGFLKNPESDGINVMRTTASAIYTTSSSDSWWSTTAAWGQNHEIDGATLEAVLLESEYNWMGWNAYGRGEYVQKTNSELDLATNPDKINDVEEITVGLTRLLFTVASLDVDLGVQGTMDFVPPSLEALYSARPLSYGIYLAVHPSQMKM